MGPMRISSSSMRVDKWAIKKFAKQYANLDCCFIIFTGLQARLKCTVREYISDTNV